MEVADPRETEPAELEPEYVEQELTEDICEQPSLPNVNLDTSFQDCDNCKILKTRIVQLQKKISWLNKSKTRLSKKLNTSTEGVGSDAGEEAPAIVAEFSSEEDMSQSSDVGEDNQENWSSLEEESHSSEMGDDEECTPDSSQKVV